MIFLLTELLALQSLHDKAHISTEGKALTPSPEAVPTLLTEPPQGSGSLPDPPQQNVNVISLDAT